MWYRYLGNLAIKTGTYCCDFLFSHLYNIRHHGYTNCNKIKKGIYRTYQIPHNTGFTGYRYAFVNINTLLAIEYCKLVEIPR